MTMHSMSNIRLSNYESDHLFELKEESECIARCCLVSGMKPHLTTLICNNGDGTTST